MNLQAETDHGQHTLHSFDGELKHLHALKLEMAGLVLLQLEQTMQALDDGDIELAHKVVIQGESVNNLRIEIDLEIMAILAKMAPVANDLRSVICTLKTALELEQIGTEIQEFAKLIMVLYDPKTSDPNPKLLLDIVKIANLVKLMVNNLYFLLEHNDIHIAYSLIKYNSDCEQELELGIKHQLNIVMQDARLIGRALDIMQILKALERSGEFCQNIAQHMIFMIEGIHIRSGDNS